jgi:outer membrane protein OmpA-like peptidoglycan-associated protein
MEDHDMRCTCRLARTLITVGLIGFASGTAIAADIADHPLVSSYPGSQAGRQNQEDFAEYQLVTGIDTDGWQPTGEKLEGRVTRTSYYSPRDRSILEIFRNYEQALAGAGFEILWKCEAADCGPSWAGSAWSRYNGMTTTSGQDKRYLAARLDTGETVAYVAVMVNKNRHEIDVIEVQEMETGLVVVNADALASALAARGRVEVPGIFFDTDKAVVKEESKAALDEIAKLLGAQPDLKVFVVGHTDITGSLDHNMTLSRARAAAVVDALVADYGIARDRLDPHGVGPLAPNTSNSSDSGRAKNRRVELVAR